MPSSWTNQINKIYDNLETDDNLLNPRERYHVNENTFKKTIHAAFAPFVGGGPYVGGGPFVGLLSQRKQRGGHVLVICISSISRCHQGWK